MSLIIWGVFGFLGTVALLTAASVIGAVIMDIRTERRKKTVQIHIISFDDDDKEPEPSGRDDVKLPRYYANQYLDLVDYAEALAKELK